METGAAGVTIQRVQQHAEQGLASGPGYVTIHHRVVMGSHVLVLQLSQSVVLEIHHVTQVLKRRYEF